jgi:cell division protein FtsZ
MSGMGLAMMGTGVAEGDDRAIEAARRAISSPLLEGASVNGARGVIINVTGGPDLSLVEVSDASTIVQEAADEDANIIFGAVVDPALKGKVKITVIATGFGAQMTSRSRPEAPAHTPVDMTHYADVGRLRADVPAAPAVERLAASGRMSIARRPLLDLPLAAASASGVAVASGAQIAVEGEGGGVPADFDASSTFDVPAFLRRQEG